MNTSPQSPLWRLTVTSQNVVVFQWHHAIGDGKSGQAFHRSLFDALGQVHGEDTADGARNRSLNIVECDDCNLLAPLEKMTDLTVSWWSLIQVIASLIIPASWTSGSTWTGNPVATNVTVPKVSVRIVKLSSEQTSLLMKAAKAHQGGLTSAFYALGVSSLCKVIARDPALQQFDKIKTSLPVSLRPFCNLSDATMGDLVSSIQRTESVRSPPMLKDGKAITTRIRDSVAGTRELIGCLTYLYGAYEGFFRGKVGKKRDLSLEVSNVGMFPPAEHDAAGAANSWKIGPLFFAQNDGVVGPALKCNVCGSPEDGCTITVTWGQEAVDDAIAEAFVEEVRNQLGQLTFDV